jgi:transcriptional regulator with XRE-family HTH domain
VWNGATLRKAREAADLTQADLAAKVGVAQATVSFWENGKSEPGPEEAEALQRVFGSGGAASGLGQAIKNARLREAWSQAKLAERLGVTQTLVSFWENGKTVPSAAHQTLLERLLGIGSGRDAGREDEGPDQRSAFAAWLLRTRQAKEMSVPELAAASGLSPLALYRIESGQTESPRQSTIARIEKALGSKVDADVAGAIQRESTVEDVGEWSEFDPHSDEELPDGGGVYVLYDATERPIYIGMSEDIGRRIREHSMKKWFIQPVVSAAGAIQIADKKLRRQVEKALIKVLGRSLLINQQDTGK